MPLWRVRDGQTPLPSPCAARHARCERLLGAAACASARRGAHGKVPMLKVCAGLPGRLRARKTRLRVSTKSRERPGATRRTSRSIWRRGERRGAQWRRSRRRRRARQQASQE
eukprot:6205516-Pleurochrysis_carterae.AAC.2